MSIILENKIEKDVRDLFNYIRLSLKNKIFDFELEFKKLENLHTFAYRLFYIYDEDCSSDFLLSFIRKFERIDDDKMQEIVLKYIKLDQIDQYLTPITETYFYLTN